MQWLIVVICFRYTSHMLTRIHLYLYVLSYTAVSHRWKYIILFCGPVRSPPVASIRQHASGG